MSLVPVFTSIKNQLLANISTIFTPFNPQIKTASMCYVQMWNNQLRGWKNKIKNNESYDVTMPCILIEFTHLPSERLGNDSMIYPDLTVKVHIVDEQFDAGDGTMEQNLEAYAIADAVHLVLEKFRPPGCVEFIRRDQNIDSDHDNLYHYVLYYATNYVDIITTSPIGGVDKSGVTPDITMTYNPSPYIKP